MQVCVYLLSLLLVFRTGKYICIRLCGRSADEIEMYIHAGSPSAMSSVYNVYNRPFPSTASPGII